MPDENINLSFTADEIDEAIGLALNGGLVKLKVGILWNYIDKGLNNYDNGISLDITRTPMIGGVTAKIDSDILKNAITKYIEAWNYSDFLFLLLSGLDFNFDGDIESLIELFNYAKSRISENTGAVFSSEMLDVNNLTMSNFFKYIAYDGLLAEVIPSAEENNFVYYSDTMLILIYLLFFLYFYTQWLEESEDGTVDTSALMDFLDEYMLELLETEIPYVEIIVPRNLLSEEIVTSEVLELSTANRTHGIEKVLYIPPPEKSMTTNEIFQNMRPNAGVNIFDKLQKNVIDKINLEVNRNGNISSKGNN